ncbi:hypothetical protein [uncultured Psychroserpens sp.]|uniref:hypothetical protein n=1 Tax=uncultured Psychroserpens sp. TaxID=255436 RepID=UPI0026152DB0|nr:hypothetical protein [uncultured Psychroserpens sp.]
MKNPITLVVVLLMSYLATAQDMNVETKSVSINNLISFIVDAIENKDEDLEYDNEHYIFLIQTPVSELIAEDKVILKQALNLVSKRLVATDNISIITYSGFNGIALKKTSSKDLKEIMYVVEHLKPSSIKELHKDGIELAYNYAKEQAEEDVLSTVVMIRNPKTMIARSDVTTAKPVVTASEGSKNNNAVLLTAISLLPQIISVIKD